jgi:hypothetical protein
MINDKVNPESKAIKLRRTPFVFPHFSKGEKESVLIGFFHRVKKIRHRVKIKRENPEWILSFSYSSFAGMISSF